MIFLQSMSSEKKDIRALSKEELRDFFESIGDKPFRGNQVYEWLWNKGAHVFDDMTNISIETRNHLKNNFEINHIEVDSIQKSNDGTIKNGVKLHDGLIVESVLIPTKKRTTACVSSQVGCSLDCKFCATARLKRMRNLNPDEIFDQVMAIDKESKLYYKRPLSNIVFMGMGEPLMNYKNVLAAIDKITSEEGLGMSSKRITLSTSGVPKMIKKLADDGVKFNLAVSLHSAIQETREQIMPFAKSFTLSDLQESLEYWYAITKRKITYEYIVWNDINDKQEDVDALVQFCKYVPCKVNLIEYNPIDDGMFQYADNEAIENYIYYLEKNRIPVTVRRSRGKDIDAACGQLANKQ
ncbi:MAG: 23S rRNA (adenine2503-C2)-methyltransferase [Saprospiraceae bacterium]|jgi:23S rRNA (adenine2503-C2)-methyltransferase